MLLYFLSTNFYIIQVQEILKKAQSHLQEVEKRQLILKDLGNTTEIKNLENAKSPLILLIDKFKPNEDEADYFRSVKAEDLSVSLSSAM